jgi:hypothetical protein
MNDFILSNGRVNLKQNRNRNEMHVPCEMRIKSKFSRLKTHKKQLLLFLYLQTNLTRWQLQTTIIMVSYRPPRSITVAIETIRSNHVHLHSQFADYHALDQFPCKEFLVFFEAFPVHQNGASAGKIDHIWFTPVTLSVLKSKPQVRRFIQLSNKMKHQADAIVAIHGKTWLFQLRA